MRKNKSILVTGGCGFVGTNLCLYLKKNLKKYSIYSIDNLKRNYSNYNYKILKENKIKNYKIDITSNEFLKLKKSFNIIIDCAADPAVEISKKKTKDVFNNNLKSTFHILEKARKDSSKLIYLSSSRVYPISECNKKFLKTFNAKFDENTNVNGVKSIYGYTKYSSELLIEEYSYIFGLKYLINRVGILTGPLQFGKVEQGLISLWIWKHYKKLNLNYIGYGGKGKQIRDILFIDDFCYLILKQIKKINKIHNELFCIGGGKKNALSLKELTKECQAVSKNIIKIGSKPHTSMYDIPIFISSNKKIKKFYNWSPNTNVKKILNINFDWIKKNYKKINNYF